MIIHNALHLQASRQLFSDLITSAGLMRAALPTCHQSVPNEISPTSSNATMNIHAESGAFSTKLSV